MSQYVLLPGARLEVGPSGLYETLGLDQAIAAKSNAEANRSAAAPNQRAEATRSINRMKRSLRGWLKYRTINDQVAAGQRRATKVLQSQAAADAIGMRDWAGEQRLASDLYSLLSEVYGGEALPSPDVAADPEAAVKLAKIAISGDVGSAVGAPQAQGFIGTLILAIAGVALFTLTSLISNRADVQKEKEHLECIKSGACTDFGFWLKAASVTVIGWFIWEKVGVGEKVKRIVRK